MNRNIRTQGMVMAGVGFILLAVTSAGYLMDWDIGNPFMAVMGLVFVAVGLKRWKRQ